MSTSLHWIKIAESAEEIPFGENNMAQMEAGGKKIGIARFKNEIFAFAPTCPHAGGYLVNGYLDALGNIVCPLHRYKFCPKNGRNISGEGYYLKHWPVELRAEGVFVGMEKSIFNFW